MKSIFILNSPEIATKCGLNSFNAFLTTTRKLKKEREERMRTICVKVWLTRTHKTHLSFGLSSISLYSSESLRTLFSRQFFVNSIHLVKQFEGKTSGLTFVTLIFSHNRNKFFKKSLLTDYNTFTTPLSRVCGKNNKQTNGR